MRAVHSAASACLACSVGILWVADEWEPNATRLYGVIEICGFLMAPVIVWAFKDLLDVAYELKRNLISFLFHLNERV